MDFQISAVDILQVVQQKNPDLVEWAVLTLQNQAMQERIQDLEGPEVPEEPES